MQKREVGSHTTGEEKRPEREGKKDKLSKTKGIMTGIIEERRKNSPSDLKQKKR